MTAPLPVLPVIHSDIRSLTERTIAVVREAIRNGALVPGELYSVYQLAARLGVSRSPVRDALLRLAETGLVRFERNRGFRVMSPDPHQIAEIMAIRLALEVPAAARAARAASAEQLGALHAEFDAMAAAAESAPAAEAEGEFMLHDQRLHALILDLAGNQQARRIVDNLRDATRLVGASTVLHSRTLADVHAEHGALLDALDAGDAEAAATAMGQHIRQTGRLLLQRVTGGDQVAAELLWHTLID